MLAKILISTFLWITTLYIISTQCQDVPSNDEEAQKFLDDYEEVASKLCYDQNMAEWAYATDVDNEEKQQNLINQTLLTAEVNIEYWEEYFQHMDPDNYDSESIKRQLKSLRILGNAALGTEKLERLKNIQSTMTNIYSTAKICPYENQVCNLDAEGLTLEPGIESVLSTSNDYEELAYVWKAWRDASGAKIRENYKSYVALSNEAAVKNGFTDKGDWWRYRYETENFIEVLDELWEQVKPLYDELHLYVARKLKAKYGDEISIGDGLIPANILGNMWAQSWVNIGDIVRPFPNASTVDVTNAMNEQGYTVLKMFEESNNFYMSMDLANNSMSYDESGESMIEKPPDREVLCHASAWDFCDGETFRIKMCTNIDMEDFITVHHEMGHIQYYLQYKDQPISFRGGANPGFHEAVGDTIAMSVSTPQHLEKIGLLTDYEDTEESSINALMDMALERVAFLPFGLLIDKWRWDVFSGDIDESEWNARWWYYRNNIQKVKAPVERSEDDFDPGAKYHVAGDSQYINYFVAHILEFQLYRGLCIAAGEYDPEAKDEKPLHKCDFYESTAAGDFLKAGLQLGSSKHWSEALQAMTGETELDASAIFDYFQPLYEYLKEENQNWSEEDLTNFLDGDYAEAAQEYYGNQVEAEWNFAVDVENKDKEKAQVSIEFEFDE